MEVQRLAQAQHALGEAAAARATAPRADSALAAGLGAEHRLTRDAAALR
jgi:hypothetical protein